MAKAVPVADARKYFDLLRGSGLLAPEKLAAVEAELDQAADATALARSLLKQSLLTNWQARQLLNGFNQLMVGKYKLLDQTATSDTARTYLAENVPMNKKVTLQILSRRLASKPQVVKKFLSDAQTAAQLDHRNLVHVFDVASDGDRHYVVTEQVAGQPLSAVGAKAAALPLSRVVSFLWQACEGLAFAHEAGVPHGDVKPANLLVDGEGTLKILNLGASNISTGQAGDAAQESGEVPTPDQLAYMAPERVSGESASIQSDLYSLGGVFGYLLTGKSPVPTGAEPSDEGSAFTVEAIQAARPDCPEVLATLAAKMTAFHSAERPATFGEVVQALKAWAQTAKAGAKKASAKAAAVGKDSGEVAISTKSNGNGAAVKARKPVVAKALAPAAAAGPAVEPPAERESADEIRIQVGEPAAAETEIPSFAIDTKPKKVAKPSKAPAAAEKAAEPTTPAKESETAAAATTETQAAPAKKVIKRKGVPVWMMAASIAGFVVLLGGGGLVVYLSMGSGAPKEVAQTNEGGAEAASSQAGSETAGTPAEGDPPSEGNPPMVENNPPMESNPPAVEANPATAVAASTPAAPESAPPAKTETPAAATEPGSATSSASDPAKPPEPASPDARTTPAPEPEKKPEPETKPEPTKPEPDKTPAPEPKKAPAPSKPADPFPGVGPRVTVDLPQAPAKGESGEAAAAFKVVPCVARPDAIMTMNLKGAESVLRGKQKFSLTEADEGRARQAWDCKLEGVEGDPVIATLKVEEGELRFRWTPAAGEQTVANALRNCLLVFGAPGRDKPVEIFLRSPVKMEAFLIDPSKPTASFKANLDSPPLEDRFLSIQFGKVEGAAASAFRPSDRLELAREPGRAKKGKEGGESREPFLWLGTKAAEDSLVLGFKLDPNVSSRNFQLSATPFYRVEAAPAPIKLIKKQLPQVLKTAEGNLVAANAREKATANLPKGDRKDQAQNIAKAEIANAEKLRDQVSAVSTLLESVGEGIKVNFTLVFNADGVDVPLLIAGDPPAAKK
jgi:serine/threonine protein kinase